jgi:transposase
MIRTTNKFSPEVRVRTALLELNYEHKHSTRWAAIESIVEKIGCVPQTLLEWIKKAEIEAGKRAGVPGKIADRMKALERQVRERRKANEILREARAYFDHAEFDKPRDNLVRQEGATARGFCH